jgi:prevent-host-death family protein
LKQKTVPAGKFKDSCLKLMEEVYRNGIPITVTKRGRPIVQVVPVLPDAGPIGLRGTVVHEDDDIFSTDEIWEADS